MLKIIGAFLLTFLIGVLLAPIVIKLAKKVGAKQEILQYVVAHKSKQGTPTMGGIIFVLPAILVCALLYDGQATVMFVALGVFFFYALLGFLDDFIKVHTHKNLGLRAYQKVIGEVGIASIIGFYMYYASPIGSNIFIPFFGNIDIGIWIIPFVIFVFLAMTNAANLTDGLDGLAGSTSFVMLIALTAILLITGNLVIADGQSLGLAKEMDNLAMLGSAVAGGVLAFLCFNSYPAKIFMGDTGSLALGGVICSLAVFSGWTLLLPLVCVVFLMSAVSVIIQVLYYKKTKKRVFLMSPLHHHFQEKGVAEPKIVAIYTIITIICCILAIVLCIV